MKRWTAGYRSVEGAQSRIQDSKAKAERKNSDIEKRYRRSQRPTDRSNREEEGEEIGLNMAESRRKWHYRSKTGGGFQLN